MTNKDTIQEQVKELEEYVRSGNWKKGHPNSLRWRIREALTTAKQRGVERERERIRAIATGVRDAHKVSLHNAVQDQKAPYRHAVRAIDEEILQTLNPTE